MLCYTESNQSILGVFLMFWLLFLITVLIMAVWMVEKYVHDRQQKDFLAVIHVNGVRGKTSTCRLLDAALRTKYRVFTKTTGTAPVWIGTDGTEHPIRRLGPANIHEQLKILRKAHRQKAQIVILECMAVQPELQKICQEQIVQSEITVITNIRRDHMFELGESPEEIAQSFSATVPRNGKVFTADERTAQLMQPYCEQNGARLLLCGTNGTAQENKQIALWVAEELGISQEQAEQGIHTYYKQDFGAEWNYSLPGGGQFLNLFSVNDPDSTHLILEELNSDCSLAFLFNHRYDRPDRLLLFCRHFFPKYPQVAIYCTGQGSYLLRRFLKGRTAPVIPLRSWRECLEQVPVNVLLVGVGSIKGEGYKMIQALEKERAEL